MRISISKKLRFEVFKRDSFKCQYCGKESPNVILEVDHIHPVSKSGKNDILNLITSCFDCNRGKGKRLLKDNDMLKKQKEQLNQLQKRREQIEMMVQWKNELNDVDNYFANNIAKKFFELTNIQFSNKAFSTIKKAIEKTSYEIVFDVFNYVISELKQNDWIDGDEISDKILNKATYSKYLIENPYMNDVFYLRKILINRFGIPKKDYKTLMLLKNGLENVFRSIYGTDNYAWIYNSCKDYFQTNDVLQECYNYIKDLEYEYGDENG